MTLVFFFGVVVWFLSHFVVALAGLEQTDFELIDLSTTTSQVLGLQPMPPRLVYVVLETELKASCVLCQQSYIPSSRLVSFKAFHKVKLIHFKHTLTYTHTDTDTHTHTRVCLRQCLAIKLW